MTFRKNQKKNTINGRREEEKHEGTVQLISRKVNATIMKHQFSINILRTDVHSSENSVIVDRNAYDQNLTSRRVCIKCSILLAQATHIFIFSFLLLSNHSTHLYQFFGSFKQSLDQPQLYFHSCYLLVILHICINSLVVLRNLQISHSYVHQSKLFYLEQCQKVVQ